jgi:hypothetical protein
LLVLSPGHLAAWFVPRLYRAHKRTAYPPPPHHTRTPTRPKPLVEGKFWSANQPVDRPLQKVCSYAKTDSQAEYAGSIPVIGSKPEQRKHRSKVFEIRRATGFAAPAHSTRGSSPESLIMRVTMFDSKCRRHHNQRTPRPRSETRSGHSRISGSRGLPPTLLQVLVTRLSK